MPLIPLRGITVFPNMVVHFDLGREKSIVALERAMMMNQTVFLVSQKDVSTDLPVPEDIYTTGTVAKIKQMLKLPGDSVRVLVDGQYRAKLEEYSQQSPYFLVSVSGIAEEDPEEPSADVMALMRTAADLYREYASKQPKLASDNSISVDALKQGGRMADTIASAMQLKVEDAQKVLSAIDVKKRLKTVIEILKRENDILKLEDKIHSKVKSSMDKSQREYYLREQIRVLHEELGDDDDTKDEAQVWRSKLEKLCLAEDITKKIEKEIDRFSKMPGNSPDVPVYRNYLESVLELPWNDASEEQNDLLAAEKILDEDHYGMEKVKDRIVEYLAVRQLAKDNKAPILCLVGAPGVGKTSIAKSVARATGREFVHMSLGGVRDEAEIRGHRRTYIGAIPGRVMTLISDCGKKNPVFLFDEVDKIGTDFRGDPASALLEVLDPEQNKEFVDHYLEVPFDLSDVLFITTANDTGTIPRPLLDRMEVLDLSGYTLEEKVNIAQKYLVPKQMKANGLTSKNIVINKSAVITIINNYTRESGVRNLEKKIGSVCRKVARFVVEGDEKKHSVTAKNIEDYLGKKLVFYDKLLGKNEVGVATGLAWTVVGGDTLFIETAVLPGQGNILLTGKLGDVMQESAKAAISYIRANQKHLGVEENFYKEKDIHIHVPEGAVPKDGPSAGVTMCVSVVSALTGKPVRKDIAMTGEITLRGKVLPVGGIKEKMLAAHRMGIRKALLPADNKRDLEDLPESVRAEMEFILLDRIEDALKEAIVW